MSNSLSRFVVACVLLFSFWGVAQQTTPDVDVPLVVYSGTPLRLRVDSTTFPKKIGDVVHARLLQPVYAFDKEVLPSGMEATGRIVGFSEPSRMARFQSMIGGHFGSFKKPEVNFDTLLPEGAAPRTIVSETAPSNGQFVEMRAGGKQKRGVIKSTVSRGKQEVQTTGLRRQRAF